MKRYAIRWLALATALAVFECLAFPRLWSAAARPSFTFVLAAAMAIRAADRRTDHDGDLLWMCFAIGLIKDLFSSGPLGGNAFVFVIAAAALVGLRRVCYVWSPLVWGGCGLGLFFAGHLLEGIAVSLAGGAVPVGRLFGVSFATAMAETALLPVALLAFRRYRVALRGA